MEYDTVPCYISDWNYRHGFFKTALGVVYPVRPNYPVPSTQDDNRHRWVYERWPYVLLTAIENARWRE